MKFILYFLPWLSTTFSRTFSPVFPKTFTIWKGVSSATSASTSKFQGPYWPVFFCPTLNSSVIDSLKSSSQKIGLRDGPNGLLPCILSFTWLGKARSWHFGFFTLSAGGAFILRSTTWLGARWSRPSCIVSLLVTRGKTWLNAWKIPPFKASPLFSLPLCSMVLLSCSSWIGGESINFINPGCKKQTNRFVYEGMRINRWTMRSLIAELSHLRNCQIQKSRMES